MRSASDRYSTWSSRLTPVKRSGVDWMPNSVSQIGMLRRIAPARAARSSAVVSRDSDPIVTSSRLGETKNGPCFVVYGWWAKPSASRRPHSRVFL
jgi:hypothetical protein